MAKPFKTITMILAISMILALISGCGTAPAPKVQAQNVKLPVSPSQNTASPSPSSTPAVTPVPIDLAKVKPNEDGKVIVAMFHNFVESFTPTKDDDGEYTTTFDQFRKLLPELYDRGFRLISLKDYLNNNISVPAGCIPMVFTFDDGTSGQFNLVDDNGKLTANKQSAVGILEDFNKTHPDFGLKATFYVNLGLETFKGQGTLDQRLKYLIDEGFEIGNHTMTHIHLNEAKSADEIEKEIGGNQKEMYQLIPGYKLDTFALPFGQASKSLQGYVAKGEYQGVSYDNLAIMEVGWDPATSPSSKSFNPLSTHRVRASGMKPVQADLAWWLQNISKSSLYVSDGDPNTITVPKSKQGDVDVSRLNGKHLNVY